MTHSGSYTIVVGWHVTSRVMNIPNFMQRFPDETSCISYLKEQREQSGVVCKHCGGPEHRRDTHKLNFRTKAGKIFQNSRTSQNTGHTRPETGDNVCPYRYNDNTGTKILFFTLNRFLFFWINTASFFLRMDS